MKLSQDYSYLNTSHVTVNLNFMNLNKANKLYLNTSHVTVNQIFHYLITQDIQNLNTSHVTVNRNKKVNKCV